MACVARTETLSICVRLRFFVNGLSSQISARRRHVEYFGVILAVLGAEGFAARLAGLVNMRRLVFVS